MQNCTFLAPGLICLILSSATPAAPPRARTKAARAPAAAKARSTRTRPRAKAAASGVVKKQARPVVPRLKPRRVALQGTNAGRNANARLLHEPSDRPVPIRAAKVDFSKLKSYRVIQVIDGANLVVKFGEKTRKIRLLGVDPVAGE